MRVVAGRFRGRKIIAPEGCETRPILDRAKVALFDWLGSRLAQPGALPPIAVLDLFCGGGSLGIEALSRGVEFVTFVDSGAAAIAALRENLTKLRISDAEAVVERGSVEHAVLRPRFSLKYSLVFLDPPYKLTGDLEPGSIMSRVWARLDVEPTISSDAWLIWRHEVSQVTPDVPVPSWRCAERRAWGHVAITAYRRVYSNAERSASVEPELQP
jgi:16S rRNA (guanine966-N2)-methyltransferase